MVYRIQLEGDRQSGKIGFAPSLQRVAGRTTRREIVHQGPCPSPPFWITLSSTSVLVHLPESQPSACPSGFGALRNARRIRLKHLPTTKNGTALTQPANLLAMNPRNRKGVNDLPYDGKLGMKQAHSDSLWWGECERSFLNWCLHGQKDLGAGGRSNV